ncbi:MAG: hypothetical protein Q9181_000433 [Wetmoreana brouardii]
MDEDAETAGQRPNLFQSARLPLVVGVCQALRPHLSRGESQGRRSAQRPQRHSRLSTSSFFGDNSSGALYPREFLEDPEADLREKENEIESCRQNEGSQRSYGLLGSHQHPSSFYSGEHGPVLGPPIDITEAVRGPVIPNRGSEESTDFTVKDHQAFPRRLPKPSCLRYHGPRHSIAARAPTSPSKFKGGEGSVRIQERRLLAPIDPPLPMSDTLGSLSNTSLVHTSYQSSPRAPKFMRPTSSSAARRTEPAKTYKSPPAPLHLTSGHRTEMASGFDDHRKRVKAADPEDVANKSDRDENLSGIHPGMLQTVGGSTLAKVAELRSKLKHADSVDSEYLAHLFAEEEPEEIDQPPSRRSPANAPKVPGTSTDDVFAPKDSGLHGKGLSPKGYRTASSPNLRGALPSQESPPPVPRLPQLEARAGSLTGSGRQGTLSPPSVVPSQTSSPMSKERSLRTRSPPRFKLWNAKSMANLRQLPSRIPRGISKTSNVGSFRTGNQLQSPAGEHQMLCRPDPIGHSTSIQSMMTDKLLPATPPKSSEGDYSSNLSTQESAYATYGTGENGQTTFPPRKSSIQTATPTTIRKLNRSNFSMVDMGNKAKPAASSHVGVGHEVTAGVMSSPSTSGNNFTSPTRTHRGNESPMTTYSTHATPVRFGPLIPAMKPVMPGTEVLYKDEEDLTIIRGDHNLIFWAGRFSAASDKLLNEALVSSKARWAYDERLRQNAVIKRLRETCIDNAAEQSLARFVSAWRGGWTGKVSEPCKVDKDILPEVVRCPVVVEEPKKKGGFMSKVFGSRKKS